MIRNRQLTIPPTVVCDFRKLPAQKFFIDISCTLGQLWLYLHRKYLMKYRTIIFYKDYFEKFFVRQRQKVRDKIIWTFDLIENLPRIPELYLKHIENTEGLYEIRVQTGSDIFRIFCFFDKGQLVVIANGFQKKSQKTPRQEIEMALKIKGEYENEKE
jgi:phage-related protein